jgi:hypothetical protein
LQLYLLEAESIKTKYLRTFGTIFGVNEYTIGKMINGTNEGNERHGTLIDPPVSVPRDMQTRNNAGKSQEEDVYHAIWLAAEAASATSHVLGHLNDRRLGLHLI